MDDKRDREERRLRANLGELKEAIRKRLDDLERSMTSTNSASSTPRTAASPMPTSAPCGSASNASTTTSKPEVGILRRRYAVRDVNWFPVAVEILVPVEEA